MPKIPVYEQQTSPNASQMPTEMPAYGQATARATGQLGAAVGKLADVAVGWEEAKAKVVADEAASQYQFDALTSLINAERDYKVEDDPSEMVNKFRGALTESRKNLIEQNTDKPFVKKALNERLDSIDRQLTVRAMSTQAEAQGKHITYKLGNTLDNIAKSAMADVANFPLYQEQAYAVLDGVGGSLGGADKKAEWSARTAGQIVSAHLQSDPVGVEEMLKEKDDPLTKSLTAEQYGKLQQAAHKGAVEVKGSEIGDAIGREAFAAQGAGGLDMLQKRIDALRKTDQEMADAADKYARQAFTREQQIYTGNVSAEEDRMFQSAAAGQAWVAPDWMRAVDVAAMADKDKRYRENLQWDSEGGAKTSNQEYLNTVMAAAFASDKTEFLNMKIDKTLLSRGDFGSYSRLQAKLAGDRTATEGDIGPTVDRYLAGYQFKGTNDQKKAREQATKTVMLDLVMSREQSLGRKLTQAEMEQEFGKAFQQSGTTVSMIPMMESTHPALDLIKPESAALISNAIRGIGGDPYPATVLKVQQDIERQRGAIEANLEEIDLPVTDNNVTQYYLELMKTGQSE